MKPANAVVELLAQPDIDGGLIGGVRPDASSFGALIDVVRGMERKGNLHMIILKSLLLIVLVISSIALIGLILLQRSKSEGLGLAFGASTGESLFRGAGRKCAFPSNRCFGGGLYGLCASFRHFSMRSKISL